MKFLIVEDQRSSIELWLDTLKTSTNIKGSIRREATYIRGLDWFKIIQIAKSQSGYRRENWPQLRAGLKYLTTDIDATKAGCFGVAGEHLIVLLVARCDAIPHVTSWLEANLPARCISFLDYVLAGDGSAKIAEQLAPLLAVGPTQLCVNHSTLMQKYENVAHNLGLDDAQSLFYRRTTARLGEKSEAKNLLKEALDFWDEKNFSFTEVEEIDRILQWYVQCKTDPGQGLRFDGTEGHDQLGRPDSLTRQFLARQGFDKISEGDDFKALFRCGNACGSRIKHSKNVTRTGLESAIRVLALDRCNIMDEFWATPFLPGILFLCQLRLMMDAFADPKKGRKPPTLKIARTQAVFTFDVDIAPELSKDKIGDEWFSPNAGGVSCGAMRAMRCASVGEPGAAWKRNKSAVEILSLLNYNKDCINVYPKKKQVIVSWNA